MKTVMLVYLLASMLLCTHQKEPVKWSFNAKKTVKKDSLWVIVIKAKMDSGWHIYSQTQPSSHICQPTVIKLVSSPLFTPFGSHISEAGLLERSTKRIADEMVTNNQYSDSVAFIITIKLKQPRVKTAVTLAITWQACTEEMCMSAVTKSFTMQINNITP